MGRIRIGSLIRSICELRPKYMKTPTFPPIAIIRTASLTQDIKISSLARTCELRLLPSTNPFLVLHFLQAVMDGLQGIPLCALLADVFLDHALLVFDPLDRLEQCLFSRGAWVWW